MAAVSLTEMRLEAPEKFRLESLLVYVREGYAITSGSVYAISASNAGDLIPCEVVGLEDFGIMARMPQARLAARNG